MSKKRDEEEDRRNRVQRSWGRGQSDIVFDAGVGQSPWSRRQERLPLSGPGGRNGIYRRRDKKQRQPVLAFSRFTT